MCQMAHLIPSLKVQHHQAGQLPRLPDTNVPKEEEPL